MHKAKLLDLEFSTWYSNSFAFGSNLDFRYLGYGCSDCNTCKAMALCPVHSQQSINDGHQYISSDFSSGSILLCLLRLTEKKVSVFLKTSTL
jgi:hypothetical protein